MKKKQQRKGKPSLANGKRGGGARNDAPQGLQHALTRAQGGKRQRVHGAVAPLLARSAPNLPPKKLSREKFSNIPALKLGQLIATNGGDRGAGGASWRLLTLPAGRGGTAGAYAS